MAVTTERYYIGPANNTTPPQPAVAYSSTWHTKPQAGAVDNSSRRYLTQVPNTDPITGATDGRPSTMPNTTAAYQLLMNNFTVERWVSGSFRLVLPTEYIGEAWVRVLVRLVSADGLTERAILGEYSSAQLPTDWTAATRTVQGSLALAQAVPGDRVVFEIGHYIASGLGGSALFHGTSLNPTADYPFADAPGVDNTKRGWIEVTLDDSGVVPEPPPKPSTRRFYLPSGVGSNPLWKSPLGPNISVTPESGWANAPGAMTNIIEMPSVPSNTPDANRTLLMNSGTPLNAVVGGTYFFVSPALDAGEIVEGFRAVVQTANGVTGRTVSLAARVSLYDKVGALRQVLYFSNDQLKTGALYQPVAGNIVTGSFPRIQAQQGDRLLVEFGIQTDNAAGSAAGGYLRFGDPTTSPDLVPGNTETGTQRPWVEFNFAEPLPAHKMVQRYYFPARNTAAGEDVPAPVNMPVPAGWTRDPDLRVKLLPFRGAPKTMPAQGANVPSGQGLDTRWASTQAVSDALPPGAYKGALRAVFRPVTTNSNSDMHLTMHARLISELGGSVRQVLVGSSNSTEVAESNNSGTTRKLGPFQFDLIVNTGDRLVVDLGAYRAPSATVARAMNMTLGDPTGTPPDFPFVDGDGSDGVPWLELTLEGVPADTPTGLEQVGDPKLTEATVVWDAVSYYPLPTGYEVRVNGGDPIDIGLKWTYAATGLAQGSSPTIEVRAKNDAGYSEWTDPLTLALKPPPVARLVWSNHKARYESGVDRGVFYPEDGPGVAWNGLVSVDDSFVGGEIEPLYLDGVLFHHMPSSRNYQATITAFSAPDEFAPSNGEIAMREGFILTRQPRKRFGFSYRVMLGDDLGYKIHLVYNATATPTSRGYKTRADSPSPSNPVWQIDAVPVESDAPRPTSHFVLDSTKIGKDQMEAIEGLLYGEKTRSPYLPSIKQITAVITEWEPKIVVPNYVSGKSPLVNGMGDVVETDVDGIYISLPRGRLAETSVRGLYQLTE